MDYRIFPPEEILETSIELPYSKSIAARAMVLDYISGAGIGRADTSCADISVLARAIDAPSGSTVDVGASGTAMRFLCALIAATPGRQAVLTGAGRMKERPVGILVEALKSLGAEIEYLEKDGFPPLSISGRKLSGGSVTLDAGESSQYISALMMVTPLMSAPLEITLRGNRTSQPYVTMTAEMMRRRGVRVEFDRDKVEIDNSPLRQASGDADMERDWSAAAFWYEIAALTAGWVTLPGLRQDSIQGDSACVKLFEKVGVLTEFVDGGAELSATPELFNSVDADMSDTPDLVPALAVTACMAGIPFRFSGVGVLHHKECDRVEALVTELAKVGCLLEVEAYGTVLQWDGRRRPVFQVPAFDTWSDHRMAMAFAGVSVFIPGIVVRDVEVVEKSYPGFWNDLRHAGFTLVEVAEEGQG